MRSTTRTRRAFTTLFVTGVIGSIAAGCTGSGGGRSAAEPSTLDSIVPPPAPVKVDFGTSQGAHVSQGQVIGYVGCTGHCFGPHLHFEVRVNGSPTDPLGYL